MKISSTRRIFYQNKNISDSKKMDLYYGSSGQSRGNKLKRKFKGLIHTNQQRRFCWNRQVSRLALYLVQVWVQLWLTEARGNDSVYSKESHISSKWGFLALCHLKQWCRSKQSRTVTGCLGMRLGSSTHAGFWAYLLLPEVNLRACMLPTLPYPKMPPQSG